MTSAELRTALQDGSVPRDARVSREGFDGWVSAGDVPELFPRTLTPPPATTPSDVEIPRHTPVSDDLVVGEARGQLSTLSGHAPVPDGAPALPVVVEPPSAEEPQPSPPPEQVVPTYATPLPPRLLSKPTSTAVPTPRPAPTPDGAITEGVAPRSSGKLLSTLAVVVVTALAGVAMWQLARPSDERKSPLGSQSLADPTPRPSASAPPPAPSASASPAGASSSGDGPPSTPPVRTKPLAACHAVKTPVKLAARVSRDVSVETAFFGKPTRIAIGFSGDGHTPQAISIDPVTLGARPEKTGRAATGKLRRVVPIGVGVGGAGGALKWAFDVDPPKPVLVRGETVAVDPPFQLGVAAGALSVVDKASESPRKLWPIPGGTTDAMQAVPLSPDGTWVAVRSGQSIFAGLLGPDHAARGELARVSEGGQSGPPAVATAGADVALVHAFRANAQAPWSLRFARSPSASLALKPASLPTTGGGPGPDAGSPSLAGLVDGRWLVAWTEGPAGKEIARAVTLSPEGEPIGAPFVLSRPETIPALPTLAIAPSGAGVALYLGATKTKGLTELWGVGLTCP